MELTEQTNTPHFTDLRVREVRNVKVTCETDMGFKFLTLEGPGFEISFMGLADDMKWFTSEILAAELTDEVLQHIRSSK